MAPPIADAGVASFSSSASPSSLPLASSSSHDPYSQQSSSTSKLASTSASIAQSKPSASSLSPSSSSSSTHAPAPAPAASEAYSSSHGQATSAASSLALPAANAPSFVSASVVHSNTPEPQSQPLASDGVILGQAGRPSPLTNQKRVAAAAAATAGQHNPATSPPSHKPHQIDPYLQTFHDTNFGAAFCPPCPSSAPPLTFSYRCRPELSQLSNWSALLESLPKHPKRINAPPPAPRTSESTPAPSSISTHPSSPLTSEHPDLAASSLTEATSIAAVDSVSSSVAGTPQLTAPKVNAWGTPKSWADTLGRNGLTSKGPIGVSVNIGQDNASSASDVGSPSVARSPKATNGKKAGRKSGAAHSKPAVVSLERLLADAHTRFDAPVTHPRGLVNKGNFCFANAILQTLVYCAPFYNLFSLIGREVPADFGNATPLMEAVIQFLREFLPADASASLVSPQPGHDASIAAASEPFVPEFVYEAMRLNKRFDQMRRGHQEDAEEFLGFFLDTLHEELISAQRRSAIRLAQSAGGPNGILAKMSEEEKKLNGVSDDDLRRLGVRVGKDAASGDAIGLGLDSAFDDDDEIVEREVMRPVSPSEEGWMEVGQKGKTAYTRTTSTSESPITRIFGGKLRSVLKTPGAKDSVTLEPYQPLQLDIQPAHVQSIEDALLHLTEPETIPGVWSPSRAAEVDATKQVFIESLPPVLVLHLKRFIYDEIGGVQKSQKPLSYGTKLEISPEVLSPAMRSQPRPRYRLFGIVYHHGRYASGGHYTVDVLRQDGHSWLHIDDTLFHTVPTEHVVRNAASTNRDYGHDGLAYLLFYRRELPGEAESASAAGQAKQQAVTAASNTTKTGFSAAMANGSHAAPMSPAVASKTAQAPPPAAAAASAKGKQPQPPQQQQQHKSVGGAKASNGHVNSAASSPRAASSPKIPGAAPSAGNKAGKKAVPGWDR